MQRVWLQNHVQEENEEMYPFFSLCVWLYESTQLFMFTVFILLRLNEFDVLSVHFLDSLIPVVVFDARWRGKLQIFVFCCFLIIIFVAFDHVNKQTLRIQLSELLLFMSTEILFVLLKIDSLFLHSCAPFPLFLVQWFHSSSLGC